jgi:Tfp pilus assembly protein PilN
MINKRSTSRRQQTRRVPGDRRLSTDRRRGSETRNAAFEVCRSHLHLALVVRGNEGEPAKVITHSLRWRNEATTLYSEIGAKELAAAFRTLVAEERLAGVTAHIALSGEFCVTRVVTGSTEDVRRECHELEERSHRYLTLGPGPKVLASSVEQLDARHEHALLTVANQRALDVLVDITDSLGLHVDTIEPSLVALSRAQARLCDGAHEACLVIHLDDDGAELGICHEGRLLLDYRPGGHTTATNVADILAQHLTRLQRHIDRNHSYLKTPLRRVYLAGEAEAVALALPTFRKFSQFEVKALDPNRFDANWQYTASGPGLQMAAALGAVMLADQVDDQKRSPNLMERIIAESQEPMRPILIRSLLPLAAVLLVAATVLMLFFGERFETNGLREELVVMEPVTARARELQLKILAADAKLAQLAALEKQLPKPSWGRLLTRIGQSMPEDVWLDSVTFADGQTASLTGSSYADGGVYDFVSHLEKVPEIGEIALQGTSVGHSASGPTTSFDLQLSLVPASDL